MLLYAVSTVSCKYPPEKLILEVASNRYQKVSIGLAGSYSPRFRCSSVLSSGQVRARSSMSETLNRLANAIVGYLRFETLGSEQSTVVADRQIVAVTQATSSVLLQTRSDCSSRRLLVNCCLSGHSF